LGETKKNPYQFVLHSSKVPWGLLNQSEGPLPFISTLLFQIDREILDVPPPEI
jgi:hypothetical protein